MRGLMIMCALLAGVSFAEDDAQRRAREELEKQLNQMVEKAPSRVRVEFLPVDDPNFQVEELEISLDGKPLKMPTAAAISGWVQDGAMPITTLDVTPGRHKVVAKVTIHNTASPMVSDEGDFRWKVAGDVGFDVATGIEVKVIVTPVRDAKQADLGKRLKLTFPSQPVMIATLDDGSMPEPTKVKPAPLVVAAAAIDAGPTKEQLAAADANRTAAEEKQRKLEEAKLAKAQAAEEKQRKLDEAKLARAQAAEAKKRKLDEAKLAKAQAAEEKKRKLEDAKAAKAKAAEDAKLAAAEKKRLAEEAKLAAARPKEDPAAVVDAGSTVVAEVPAVVDAGAAVVVAELKPAEPVDAGVAVATAAKPEPAPESEGPPWMIIGGVIGVAALGLIVVLMRRAGRVPELKD